MHVSQPSPCDFPNCLAEPDNPDDQYRRELKALLAFLTPAQRRLYAAVKSNRLGRGGVRAVAELTGLCPPTIARGRRELADLLQGKPPTRERKPVRGRPRIEEKYPTITTGRLESVATDG